MNTMTLPWKKFNPFIQSNRNRILFIIINIYLILGVGSLLFTLTYLAGHLNQSDSIFKYCIAGFVIGVSSVVFYFIGYHTLTSKHNGRKSNKNGLAEQPY
jgi:hypothetical protein